MTQELAREVSRRAKSLPPGAFRAWSLTQPWPKFCAIVRIVSGQALDDMLDQMAREDEEEEDDDDHR